MMTTGKFLRILLSDYLTGSDEIVQNKFGKTAHFAFINVYFLTQLCYRHNLPGFIALQNNNYVA